METDNVGVVETGEEVDLCPDTGFPKAGSTVKEYAGTSSMTLKVLD